MAQLKPHLRFKNPPEGTVTFKPKKRSIVRTQEEEEITLDYYKPMRDDFIRSRDNFFRARASRRTNRNPNLQIPENLHVEYVQLQFFDWFDNSIWDNYYRRKFGLASVWFTDFNRIGFFAVIDRGLFQHFFEQIERFINAEDHNRNITYDKEIRYIKNFRLLTTDVILGFETLRPHVILHLTDSPDLEQPIVSPLRERLFQYLNQRGIHFEPDIENNRMELWDIPDVILREIADNFDLLLLVSTNASGVIRPNRFNLPERGFGFSVKLLENEELPIIGIIDTGVSNQSPIAPLLLNNDNEFDLTGSPATEDSADHGTAVATLAALGTKPYPDFRGEIEADARILSIKILEGNSGFPAEKRILAAIQRAHQRYGVKIFVLTVCYDDFKATNSTADSYTVTLDRLAYELDILIFVCTGNYNRFFRPAGFDFSPCDYPEHFGEPETNICTPADSMNNITVGALSGNLNETQNDCFPVDRTYPATYTRTCHLDWNQESVKQSIRNKNLYKPDVSFFGGDVDGRNDNSQTGLPILSVSPGLFYVNENGTSFSTPLVANLAARILRVYPALANNMQAVKALLLNAAQKPRYTNNFPGRSFPVSHLIGNGLPDEFRCVFSDENSVVMLLEDAIKPGELKVFPIHIPKYLAQRGKERSLVRVSATLCFRFNPVQNNQLAYCPIHIAYGFFRNVEIQADDANGNPVGINENATGNIRLKANLSWSEDYYWKAKLLSNVQKMEFVISKPELEREGFTFKIAVRCRLHRLLQEYLSRNYQVDHPFTLAISIEEESQKGALTGNLYNEMVAINQLEVLNELEGLIQVEL